MKPDKKLVADILKTLPVGYYLGSRAEVVLDETSPSSFVNMMTKEIHVSYGNVADAMEVLPDDSDPVEVENAIRCFLYHETAHLMLSPIARMNRRQGILEDERIETLLRDTFHGVDFKRNVYRAWSWSPDEEPKNFDQFFDRLVRLRIGPEELLTKLDALIANHAISYAGKKVDDDDDDDVLYLLRDYNAFITECEDEWEKPKEDTPPPPPPDESGSPDDPDDKEKGEDGEAGDTPPPKEDGGKGGAGEPDDDESEGSSPKGAAPSGESPDGADPDGDEGESPDGDGSSGSSPSGDDGGGGSRAGHSSDATDAADDAADKASKKVKAPKISDKNLDEAKEIIADMLKRFTDSKTRSGMRRIIIRACNRKAARSGVENGYSGRIDPKSVWRPDYRWLMKSGDSGTGKDRLHLRLWVDVSGSFCGSQMAINKLISTLLDLEKEMPSKFSLAVIEMGGVDDMDYEHDPTANRVHDKTKEIECRGGNDFGPSIGACDIATRRPGWRTMNIVVWDGWALRPFEDDKRIEHLMKRYPEACAALNNRQTIIISDPSNTKMISKGMPLARTTYVSGGYAKRFTEEVLRQLEYAI